MTDDGRSTDGNYQDEHPARLDRLPWSRFRWRIVFGLGTAWVLDGLEVTMVASVGSRLTQKNAGLGLTVSQIGVAGAIYIAGACIGALFFGQMCDRFGRKKLFVITLVLKLPATPTPKSATKTALIPVAMGLTRARRETHLDSTASSPPRSGRGQRPSTWTRPNVTPTPPPKVRSNSIRSRSIGANGILMREHAIGSVSRQGWPANGPGDAASGRARKRVVLPRLGSVQSPGRAADVR